MFEPDQYTLIDIGGGRKLERFGPLLLDRPCPAAARVRPAAVERWQQAAARFVRTGNGLGEWSPPSALPADWTIRHGAMTLMLKPNESGNLGVFPEHALLWDWIEQQVRLAGRPLKVLNLFGYTGGSTLAAASAGGEVTHVDAAKNIVARARQNAQTSGLADRPLRWASEDAVKFARRELDRGHAYDAVILDPPSYGRGPRGELWKLVSGLAPLLKLCGQLTAGRPAFLLLTCHTPGYGPARLARMMTSNCNVPNASRIGSGRLTLVTETGKKLRSGAFARWPDA